MGPMKKPCGLCEACIARSVKFIEDVEAAVWIVADGNLVAYRFMMADVLDQIALHNGQEIS